MKRRSYQRKSETQTNENNLQEITHQATIISSSSKEGNGVEHLLDKDDNTFWESSGDKPHSITFIFNEYRNIALIRIRVIHAEDGMYVPSKIITCAGKALYDMNVIGKIGIGKNMPEFFDVYKDLNKPIKANCISISFQDVHENGMDCRVRDIEIYELE